MKKNRYMTDKNVANIKLQSSCAFFPDARADAHEKMRNRLQFFFVSSNQKYKKVRLILLLNDKN